jgi:hypothetical protein
MLRGAENSLITLTQRWSTNLIRFNNTQGWRVDVLCAIAENMDGGCQTHRSREHSLQFNIRPFRPEHWRRMPSTQKHRAHSAVQLQTVPIRTLKEDAKHTAAQSTVCSSTSDRSDQNTDGGCQAHSSTEHSLQFNIRPFRPELTLPQILVL